MKVKKTCEVGGTFFEMIQENGMRVLTMGQTSVPLEEVRELVEWLQTEVLSVSVTTPVSLRPVPMPSKDAPVSSVQQFPPLETRTTGRITSDVVPVVESAIKPGEIDPLEGRKVSPEQRGKYKGYTSIPAVDLRGVEQAQGYVETPIRVKV